MPYTRSHRVPLWLRLQENDLCCWTCRTCGHYQKVVDEYDCQECPPGSLPSPSKRNCVMVPLRHVDYSSPWALAAIALAVVGESAVSLCGGCYKKAILL